MGRTRTTWGTAAIVLSLSSSLLAACSSSSSLTAAAAPASTSPASSAAPIPPPSSPVASSSPSAVSVAPATFAATGSGTATDSQGDAATVSVSVGTPVPQLSLNQAELTGCTSEDVISDGADQTMAIPLQITATLTSSIATDVLVEVNGTQVVAPGGNVTGNPNMVSATWAAYSGDSACTNSGGIDGTLEWDNVAPGQTVTWSGWELDPDVITPDDTSGNAVDQVTFQEPGVSFGNGGADFTYDTERSQNLVTCPGQIDGGPIIAVDASIARANGCTASTGS